jgi:predicted MFS family arabinose efflux permease
MNMLDSVKSLFKNKNYMFMFTSFNFLYGLYCAISGVISSFTVKYGYDTQEISVICLVFSVAGILNSFFLGTLLDKYQCYRKALITLCCSSIITLGLSAVGLPHGDVAVEGGIMMFTGASLIPVVTVCFSFAAELSYPVPESYSIGIMLSFA